MTQKNVIDKNGHIICSVMVDENDNILFTDMILEKGQQLVPLYLSGSFVKPKWNGEEWVEGATEEEIKAWNEENKVIKQTTTEEKLTKEMAILKIDNMKKDTVISNLTKAVAELKIKIMNMEEGK